MRLPVLLAAALLATAFPADAQGDLFERNRAVLQATVPQDAVLEVQTWHDGELMVQLWTAEQYISFRAAQATAMGRDYSAGFQGIPSGTGDQHYLGDVWTDHWGTTRINVAVPRGIPRTIDMDKLWLYGSARSIFAVAETENQCYFDPFFMVNICSSTFGWFYPQSGSEHGDSWFGFQGILIVFAPPLGSVGNLNGAVFAENL